MVTPRILRIGGSFGTVVLLYWIYAFLAVPWIEPPADPVQIQQLTKAERDSALQAWNRRVEELKPLFRPGDWELNNPKILESGQIRLLSQDIPPLQENGYCYVIKPCTLIYSPDEPADDPAERMGRSVVMQVPEGALLEFSQGFDLLSGKFGGLVRGELRGPITIRSSGKDPGPDDDFLAVTRDIHLSNDRLWTNEKVEFRWGNSYGQGANLQINLLQDSPLGSNPRTPKITGIDWIEVRHIDRLHLEPGQHQGPAVAAGKTGAAGIAGMGQEPLLAEVTLRGPLRFDVRQQEATLRDQVTVLQLHPNGPSDQLNCEVLSIYFARRRVPPSSGDQAGVAKAAVVGASVRRTERAEPAFSDLQARRIIASGNPVTVHAPSPGRQLQARGERLEYDLWNGRIFLQGAPEASFQQGANEIHAPSLQYEPAKDQGLGQALVQGPGWLRGQSGDRPEQQFKARWNEQLSIRPDQGQQAISLTGGAQVASDGFGSLGAGQIHLWLMQVPTAPGQRPQVRPDRMLAEQDVRLDSPQVSGSVERLEVWFKVPDAAQLAAERQKAEQVGLFARMQSQLEQAQLAMQLARSLSQAQHVNRPLIQGQPSFPLPAAGAGNAVPANAGAVAGPTDSAMAQTHFEVVAKRLQALVLVRGEQTGMSKPTMEPRNPTTERSKVTMEPSELTIEGDVRLAETVVQQPDQRPVVITGDQIRVLDAAQPYAAVTIIGRPAHFEGQGMAMTGGNINLNRGQNRLWMDGPGQMNLDMDRDLEGRPLQNPGELTVQWQQRMNFNGRIASFNGAVVAHAQDQQFQTEVLEVSFRDFIRFTDSRSQPKPDPVQITCQGGVVMHRRTIDGTGQTSVVETQFNDLAIDRVSGRIAGNGPGWMTSIRRGDAGLQLPGNLGAAGAPMTPAVNSSSAAVSKGDQLTCLNIRFQGGITGNIHERSVTFHEKIRAVYGPVAAWEDRLNPDDPSGPKPGAATLTADELTVVEMPQPLDNRRSSPELTARGNTIVQGATPEGATFTARAHQVAYAQSKDQLILNWDGTTYSELFYQQSVGGRPYHEVAQKIVFYPLTRKVDIEGHRYAELTAPPAPRRGT